MISNELKLANLSMDSYNRGCDEEISSLGGVNTQVGDATLVDESDTQANSDGVNAGFYAAAYTWNGKTIISYRGTDDADFSTWSDLIGSDPWNGYGTAIAKTLTAEMHKKLGLTPTTVDKQT